MIDSDFPSHVFSDPEQAERNLVRIHEAFIRSGSRFTLEDFVGAVRRQLLASADAGMALTNLIRFSEAAVSKASLFNDLVQYPVALEVLMSVFAHSQYFADILVREPGLFRWLTTSDALVRPLSRESLRDEVRRLRTTFDRPAARLESLKRLHRREMLRIGTQDLLGAADLPSVALQLSDLADVIVDEICEISARQISDRYGDGPPVPFAVIGLGKLGGAELNYSSDIDVVFVYQSDGEFQTPGGATVSTHEYFVRLSEKTVQNLSQPTGEGHLYRVDTRLRPESGAGPLARSLPGYLTYYESRGELWERQMLIKARPIAGDAALGAAFLRELVPFVYPRSLFHHPAEYIMRIKARIEAAIGDGANVKLMRGGIRDIEFAIQVLQLLNAAKNPALRLSNTLLALEALVEAGVLPRSDADALHAGYVFFRTLEHRLQTVFNTQTHLIPEDALLRTALARRMRFHGPEALLAEVGRHARNVRAVFDKVTAIPGTEERTGGRDGDGILALLDGGVSEASADAILRRHGFSDLRAAARHIRTLTTGSSMSELRELDTRSRDSLRCIAPQFFSDIGRTPIPDFTLANLTRIVTAQKFPEQMYSALGHDGFRSFLLGICAISPRFSLGLANDPLFLEVIAADIDGLNREPAFEIPPIGDVLPFKLREELRAGIRHLLGFTGFGDLTEELSSVADAVVTSVSEDVTGGAREKLGVFALGKFGTKELTFDSDLDIIFVSGAAGPRKRARMDSLAGSIISRLTAVEDRGKLYTVDVRLRPEGRSAPLVVDAGAFAQYLASRATLWERQSLTRIRFVCGDARLIGGVDDAVRRFVYDAPLPHGWIAQTISMRRRTESRSRVRARDFIDLKLGAGGLMDIEFLVQMIQLATRREDLRHRKIVDVLSAPDIPGLSGEERSEVSSAYGMLRRIELLMRITLEERGSILPEGDRLELLARCAGGGSGDELATTIRRTMQRVRAMFLRAGETLGTTIEARR